MTFKSVKCFGGIFFLVPLAIVMLCSPQLVVQPEREGLEGAVSVAIVMESPDSEVVDV